MSLSAPVLDWFLVERGIAEETLEAFGVHEENGTLVIPYAAELAKYRQGIPHGERKFWFTKGSKPPLFNAPAAQMDHVFLCEGETDTMRLWQELQDTAVGVVGLSGIDTWQDSMAAAFDNAKAVWVVLDNDTDYMVQGRVDNAWRSIRKALGPKAKRITLPKDVKDLCEFFTLYELDDLRSKVTAPTATTHYKPLDLSRQPPPVQWLAWEQLALGDVTVLLGESNVGKSFLTLSLALAVAQGGKWLGLPIEPGRVLYVDEENPEDVIYDRLRRLGMTEEGQRNIHYLWNQRVRLDRDPDKLLDDALNLQPKLIVLDSLARIHSQDENSAGAMSALYDNGIKPLARETGACVVLLHHTSKTDSTSSYMRSRGSGDITASADAGLDARAIDAEGTVSLATYKTRRRGKNKDALFCRIEDTLEGGVAVRRIVDPEPPF